MPWSPGGPELLFLKRFLKPGSHASNIFGIPTYLWRLFYISYILDAYIYYAIISNNILQQFTWVIKVFDSIEFEIPL